MRVTDRPTGCLVFKLKQNKYEYSSLISGLPPNFYKSYFRPWPCFPRFYLFYNFYFLFKNTNFQFRIIFNLILNEYIFIKINKKWLWLKFSPPPPRPQLKTFLRWWFFSYIRNKLLLKTIITTSDYLERDHWSSCGYGQESITVDHVRYVGNTTRKTIWVKLQLNGNITTIEVDMISWRFSKYNKCNCK